MAAALGRRMRRIKRLDMGNLCISSPSFQGFHKEITRSDNCLDDAVSDNLSSMVQIKNKDLFINLITLFTEIQMNFMFLHT